MKGINVMCGRSLVHLGRMAFVFLVVMSVASVVLAVYRSQGHGDSSNLALAPPSRTQHCGKVPATTKPPRKSTNNVHDNSVVAVGDSITRMNADPSAGILGNSWFADEMQTGRQYHYLWNAAVAQSTTADMLARLHNEVVARRPDVVFIMGGTNDVGRVAEKTTVGNILAMIRCLEAAHIRVIVFSINPRSDARYAKRINSLNSKMCQLAGREDVGFVDTYDAVSTGSGVYRPGYSTDGVHPSAAASRIMAQAARPQLSRLARQ